MKKQWANNVAVEAIEHQGESSLYKIITDGIKEFRESGELTDGSIAGLGLAAKIEDNCGISVKFQIDNSPFVNAAVKIPQLDKNHTVIASIIRIYAGNDDLLNVKKFSGNKLVGVVDKKDSKVYGGFSKLTCPVFMTTGLLTRDDVSNEEVAAVILHELGHVFTYFERLIDVVTANYAITVAADKMLGLESDVDRMEILSELDKYIGITIPDKENVVHTDDKGMFYTHVSCEVVKQRRNEEGNDIYSYRGFEFAADQFATRHGAGASLVSILDKMNRMMFLNPSYVSWPTHVAVELAKAASVITLAVGSLVSLNPFLIITGMVIALTDRPLNKLYDDPAERFERIDREMVSELKNRQLDDKRRQQIVDDLFVIRELTKKITDKRTLWEIIWTYVSPTGKESTKNKEFQKSLERLVNNDLYLASAILK